MTDGARALDTVECDTIENLANEAHRNVPLEGGIRAIGGDDAGTLLPSMLEREKSVIGQDGRIRVAEDGKDAAFVGRFVVHQAGQGGESSGGREAVKRSRKNGEIALGEPVSGLR